MSTILNPAQRRASVTLEERDLDYLKLLAKQYPSIRDASTEIINLNAIVNLPKGTEHFLSDIHGEYEAFVHVLKNCSGSIRRKIDDLFADEMLAQDRRSLASLIYYPEQRLALILQDLDNPDEWFRITLFRLVRLCKATSSKYTRSKVRKAIPVDFVYTIEELLHEQAGAQAKQQYYESIIDTIISTGLARDFIVALAELIQRLTIDHLHIIGDIYDRGPGAHIIMDKLIDYHSVDIQWGNHDIVWMGAAAGSEACIANVLRICLRYSNMTTLQDGYAISLLPLATFAMDVYGDDPCPQFIPKPSGEREYSDNELKLMSRMHKAITIIQFKLESEIIKRRPQYGMDDRLLLDKVDYEKGIINLNGQEYTLNDTNFPTIDPQDPYALTADEQNVVNNLKLSFTNNERLQRHVRFLYSKGSMYLIHNGNLLYHGCIPMNEDGSFQAIEVNGKKLITRDLMDHLEQLVRQAYLTTDDPARKLYGLDTMWYLWIGENSPLFGKDKMATFERYFIDDKRTHTEAKSAYYTHCEKETTVDRILQAFGLDPATSHIVNGHVPVKVNKGESPVKAGGKLLIIDGGFSKAYQTQTGIAGYTLVYNSYGLLLASHHPFESTQEAIAEELDIHSQTTILETNYNRIRVRDTDKGRQMQQEIADLQALLKAYRVGLIKEQTT